MSGASLRAAIEDRWPAVRSVSDAPSVVKIADTDALLSRVGRLRYRRFVIDQGQKYPFDNHERNPKLIDPIDRFSLNLFLEKGSQLSTALRLSWCSDVSSNDYLDHLHSRLPDHITNSRTVICSRLVTATNTRGDLGYIVVLFRRAFEIAILSGCTHSIISTLPQRTQLFQKFGFRETGSMLADPIAGTQLIMMLDLYDLDYLQSVGSPLLPVLRSLSVYSSKQSVVSI